MPKKQAASAPAISAELIALILERDDIIKWLEPAKSREMELRLQIAASLFPNPVEGANRLFTEDGFEVYLDHKINRTLDVAALDTIMMELPEDCDARVPGVLVQYKPALVMSGFRNLPEDQLKIFQQVVTESPGAPTLEISKADTQAPATPIMDAYQTAKEKHAAPAARLAKIKKAAAKAPKKIKATKARK